MDDRSMVGKWMLTRLDGELVGGEYRWVVGGEGPEPDWEWFDDEYTPVEVLAERFMQTITAIIGDHRELGYTRETRRRWFGLTEHEYDAGVCVNCELDHVVAAITDAPWDGYCKPGGES